MKKLSAFIRVHLWAIFLFVSVSVSAQEFKIIRDGVEYAEMTRGTKEEPFRINLLKLDLTKVRLDVAHAMDAAIGLEKTSSIAARHDALAAINGGFFRLDRSIFAGDATGVLMINRTRISDTYANRIALFIANNASRTDVFFEHFGLQDMIRIGKEEFYPSGINRERKENEIIEYTPEFHRTTLTDKNGVEIIVENNRIKAISDGAGNNVIPQRGFIISANGKKREALLKIARIGRKVERFTTDISKETSKAFPLAEDIVGGVPQLIKNGKIEITWQQEKSSKAFVETRHPRTAVAKLKDGKFLMVAVDGRQAGYSVGMNLNELAAFLLELGAQDAMNLDGGGSTTMFLDGKVVNKPSDKEGERSVSDAILVFPRKRN
ncbi:MAG TPA: phosphodiester glycosidase family protein [Pyrinomonadaceae bacterium]|jgi:exopolysaccharide biosynthesis protein